MTARTSHRLLIATLASACLPVLAAADTTAKNHRLKPRAVDMVQTGSVMRLTRMVTDDRTGNVAALKSGLDALAAGDIDGARARRSRLASGTLDRHIMDWAIALFGGDRAPSGEIAAAADELAGWPGLNDLRKNSEAALFRENPEAQAAVQAFGGSQPQTAKGAIVLAKARLVLGDRAGARAALATIWRTAKLDPADEAAVVRQFGAVLTTADHRIRMEQMLYDERAIPASKVSGLAKADALYRAWSAVIGGSAKAGALLDAVPGNQRGAGYAFARARFLRGQEKFRAAADLMLNAPRDRDSLIDPDAWWVERRVLSRELIDQGDAKLAYRVAAAHSAESPVMAADAEFHAGWYALRALNDPKTASRHFGRIAVVASGPISLSRAYYWLGRTAEAGGPGDSHAAYRKAAAYTTTFYGQLAAAKLGVTTLGISYPEPSAAGRADFQRREAVVAIGRLEQAGYPDYARSLYRALADQLTSPGELALLAARAEKRGDHFTALKIGKAAAARGLDIGALAHPTGAIPASANISGSGMALAYAIARQESEFKTDAISGAGARGLLQLLPGTAREMAKKTGRSFSQAKLTTDAAYNASLGSAFLGQQLDRFGGSYVLTFAGYNAGPRRAADWVGRYGDPRGKDVDAVVDWIERIPFTETRNYVQRVMENYQVYKMRLTGRFDIDGDLTKGG